MSKGKARQSFWLLVIYFIVGLSIIHFFKTMEYPYWLGVFIAVSLIYIFSYLWKKYKSKATNNNSLVSSLLDEGSDCEYRGLNPIAGIESVVIDENYHFYAYDFSSDEVVSPLFASGNLMAEFAENNLEQKDGQHSKEYWLELIKYSKEESEIFGEPPIITKNEMADLFLILEQAKNTNVSKTLNEINPFISDILINLKREYIDTDIWNQVAVKSDVELMDLCSEDIVEMINRVLGIESEYEHVDISDAAIISVNYLDAISENLDYGWEVLFKK